MYSLSKVSSCEDPFYLTYFEEGVYSAGHYQPIRPKLSQDSGAESLQFSEKSTVVKSLPASVASTVAESLTGSETPTLTSTPDCKE